MKQKRFAFKMFSQLKMFFSFEFVVYVRLRLGQGSIEISSTFIKQKFIKLYIFDS